MFYLKTGEHDCKTGNMIDLTILSNVRLLSKIFLSASNPCLRSFHFPARDSGCRRIIPERKRELNLCSNIWTRLLSDGEIFRFIFQNITLDLEFLRGEIEHFFYLWGKGFFKPVNETCAHNKLNFQERNLICFFKISQEMRFDQIRPDFSVDLIC